MTDIKFQVRSQRESIRRLEEEIRKLKSQRGIYEDSNDEAHSQAGGESLVVVPEDYNGDVYSDIVNDVGALDSLLIR